MSIRESILCRRCGDKKEVSKTWKGYCENCMTDDHVREKEKYLQSIGSQPLGRQPYIRDAE